MTILKRTLAGAPAALVVTAGLGVLMAGLIKVEYEARNENPEQLSFVINEAPEDIEITRTTEIPVLRDVEVPPPPPVVAVPETGLPSTDIYELDVHSQRH